MDIGFFKKLRLFPDSGLFLRSLLSILFIIVVFYHSEVPAQKSLSDQPLTDTMPTDSAMKNRDKPASPTKTKPLSGELNKEPISWDELQSSTFQPRRDQKGTDIYAAHVKQLLSQGRTPEQVVLMDVFGMTEQRAIDNAKQGKATFRLVVNSFPYWFEKNIVHLLVFSNQPNWDRANLENASKQLLYEHLPQVLKEKGYDVLIHINPPAYQTVKGLGHAHVFIRDTGTPLRIYELLDNIPFSRPFAPPSGWPNS